MHAKMNVVSGVIDVKAPRHAFTYQWGDGNGIRVGSGRIPEGSFLFNFSGQTPCCMVPPETQNVSIVGTCNIRNGLQPSFSWNGTRIASSNARVLYLVPTGMH